MDSQVSSNFERLLFDLSGRDGGAVAAMMGEFDSARAMTIPQVIRTGARGLFSSARVNGDAMTLALRSAQECAGQNIHPPRQVGLAVRRGPDLPPPGPGGPLAAPA